MTTALPSDGRETCCAGDDIHDARRVADRLGIPHYVLDYQQRFRSQVMDPFADSYLAGETPIPCVLCNQTVKFTDLFEAADTLGADLLVTGHYARRVRDEDGPALHRGVDTNRDQSYFLFATTRRQLERLRFPLGGLSKDETRTLAQRHGLPVAAKSDSQDICFVPAGGMPASSSNCAPAPANRERSWTCAGAFSAGTGASSTSPSGNAVASASPPASRCTWCGWNRKRAASSSAPNGICGGID